LKTPLILIAIPLTVLTPQLKDIGCFEWKTKA